MIVIDTHVLLWWINRDQNLSTNAAKAIHETLAGGSEVIVSSISAWEIARLITAGRLVLSVDVENWLDEVTQVEGVRFVPVDNEIGIKSTMLPGEFHRDPADRMIVATARKLAIPLVTADEKIRTCQHLKTIW